MSQFIRVSETERAKMWLMQFDENDRERAKKMLDSIKYVSHDEFSKGIERKISELIQSDNEVIAVYPVISYSDKPSNRNNPFGVDNQEDVYEFGSEDRVGHIINNLKRAFTSSDVDILINPTIGTLFKRKVKKIILVDDLCGSGGKIIEFYQKIIPIGLKRYISLKVFELHLVLYGGMKKGLDKIKEDINYFNKNERNIHIVFPELSQNKLDDQYIDLCRKYHKRLKKRKHYNGLGYGNSLGKIVFEHGCPNNVPDILFQQSKKWIALFPNRSTANSDVIEGFGEHSMSDLENILNIFRQNKLAYQIYKKDLISVEERLMITVLGLIKRSVKNINEILLIEKTAYSEIIARMLVLGMVVDEGEKGFKVTLIGEEIMKKFKKNSKLIKVDNYENSYYPTQYGGYNRSGKT